MPLRFNQLVRSKKYKASLKKVVQSIISHKAYYRILNPGDTTKPGPQKVSPAVRRGHLSCEGACRCVKPNLATPPRLTSVVKHMVAPP